jgi:hypothetical protein
MPKKNGSKTTKRGRKQFHYMVKDPNAFRSSPQDEHVFWVIIADSQYNIIHTRIPYLSLPHFSNINC